MIINRTSIKKYGLNVSIFVDKNQYVAGEDIKATIKLDKKVLTASYYLKYDSAKIEFKEKSNPEKGSLSVKDYPNDNLVRAIYLDMDNSDSMGTDEMTFVFTAKEDINSIPELKLDNTTMTIQGQSDPYKNVSIGGIDALPKNESEKNKTSKNSGDTAFYIMLVLLIKITIYIIITILNNKKNRKK
jgi:hypothetical protein